MSATKPEIVLAYRHLYQHLLRGVQYSQPARFVARDHLRATFRNGNAQSFDGSRIARTLLFLDGAIKSTGLEHKIVKNLIHVWWARQRRTLGAMKTPEVLLLSKKAYAHFDQTIENLNDTMGLCIK